VDEIAEKLKGKKTKNIFNVIVGLDPTIQKDIRVLIIKDYVQYQLVKSWRK
jgi:hypothetical protein